MTELIAFVERPPFLALLSLAIVASIKLVSVTVKIGGKE
jgi:hypothetical protein